MVQSVLDSANDAIDKEQLASAVHDLAGRVDDWKSLKVEGFGDLLRFGTFTVLKGDTTKDTEREVSFARFPSQADRRTRADVAACSITSTSSNEFSFVARTSTPTSRNRNLWVTRINRRQNSGESHACN